MKLLCIFYLLLLFIPVSFSKQLDQLEGLLKLPPSKAFEYSSTTKWSYRDILSKSEIGNLIFVLETSQRMRTPNTFLMRDEVTLALLQVCLRSSNYNTLIIIDGNGKEYFNWNSSDRTLDVPTINHIMHTIRLNPYESESVIPGIQSAIKLSEANRLNSLNDLIYVIGDSLEQENGPILKEIKELKYPQHIYFDYYSMNPIYRHEYPKNKEEEAFKHKPHRNYRVLMQYLQSNFLQFKENTANNTLPTTRANILP